jgi:hypothetical protein
MGGGSAALAVFQLDGSVLKHSYLHAGEMDSVCIPQGEV